MDQTHTPPQRRPFAVATPHFASGSDTPRMFLERCLADLAAWEPSVGAFTVTRVDAARRDADASSQRWLAGTPLSPIDGMPVGIKDIIDTDDMPTEHGSALFAGHQPRYGAASAIALRMAGAVILGKTVTTEFAASEPRGTRNPWDLGRTPGGSSSGSAAAVAAGMVSGAMGTQVVGSIIRPAGFCGVVGYKPSLGGINRGGSLDLLSQSVSGTLAASLDDAWIMAMAIVARVGGDPGFAGIMGPATPPAAKRPARLALLQTGAWDVLEPGARAALDGAVDALRRAGIAITTRQDSPALEAAEHAIFGAHALTMAINAWEWRWPLGAFMAQDSSVISASAHARAEMAAAMTQAEYAAALARRAEIRAVFSRLFGEVDALISVTAPGPAPLGLESTGNAAFVVAGSLLGVPVVTLPVMQVNGLPLGLQVIGFSGGDAELFGVAAGIEAVLNAGLAGT